MEIHTAIAPTQLLLWILLGFLSVWMVTFACLAIKRMPEARAEITKAPSPRVIPLQQPTTGPLQNVVNVRLATTVAQSKTVRNTVKETVLEQSVL